MHGMVQNRNQSDISKVQVGQRVRVTSDSIASELTGTVERVGSHVRRKRSSTPICTVISALDRNRLDAKDDNAAPVAQLKFRHAILQSVQLLPLHTANR